MESTNKPSKVTWTYSDNGHDYYLIFDQNCGLTDIYGALFSILRVVKKQIDEAQAKLEAEEPKDA